MTIMITVYVVGIAGFILGVIAHEVYAGWRVERENARRWRDWQSALVEARTHHTMPPAPPNRVRRG